MKKLDTLMLCFLLFASLIIVGFVIVPLAVNGMLHNEIACDGKLHIVKTHGDTDYYWTCVDGNILYLTHER